MKIDLAALTLGLSAAAPGAAAKVPAIGSQVGKRTADSPFAVLLASAVPGRWSEGSSGAAATPTVAEPALVTLGLGAAKAGRAATGQAGHGARRGELQHPAQPATPPLKAEPGAGAEGPNLLAGRIEGPPTPTGQAQAQAQAQGATGADLAQPEQPVVEVQEAVESQPLPAQAPSPSLGGEGAALAAQAAMASRLQVASPSPAPRTTSPAPSAAAGAATAQGIATAQGLEAKRSSSGASPLARAGVPVAQGAPAGLADPAGAADAAATLRVAPTGPQVKPPPAGEPQARFAGPVQAKAAPGPQDSSTAQATNSAAAAVQPGAAATQAAAAARLGTVRAQARAQDGNVTATTAQTRNQDHAGGRSSARLAEAPAQAAVRAAAPAQPALRAAAPGSTGRAPLQTERASGAAPSAPSAAPAVTAPPVAGGAPTVAAPPSTPREPVVAPPSTSPRATLTPSPATSPQAPVVAAPPAWSTPGSSRTHQPPAPVDQAGPAAASQAEPPLDQARADARASRREEAGRRAAEPVAIPRRGAAADRPSAPAPRPTAAPEAAARPAPTAFVARDLSTTARLTHASRAGQPLPEAGEPQRARTSRPAGEQLPQHAAPLQAQAPAPEPAAPKAAAPVHRPAPVVQEPLQTGVTGTILPAGAHLRLESETLGDLALHLRIRDGVAHLRVEGEQASALAGRGHELQRALAAEGLQLGKLELDRPQPQAPQPAEASRGPSDQSLTQGQRERPEQGEPGGAAGHAPGTSTSPQGRRPQGRTTAHHVEA